MGIPHLTTTLQPFARREALNGKTVVIDGPAFAYHIIYLCELASRPIGPLTQPSPALLGETALAWLDMLERHKISV